MSATYEDPSGAAVPVGVEVSPRKKLGFGGWFALIWLGLVIFCAVLGHLIPGISAYSHVYLDHAGDKPLTKGHLLGVDDNGHDVVSMLVLGARASLEVAFGAVAAGILLGGSL